MINSSKISFHRFIAITLFRVVKEWPHLLCQRMATLIILCHECNCRKKDQCPLDGKCIIRLISGPRHKFQRTLQESYSILSTQK